MSLDTLPYDVLSQLEKHLDDESALALCITSRCFFDLLKDRAFSKITLTETSAPGDTILELMSDPHADLVHTIHFCPNRPKPVSGPGSDDYNHYINERTRYDDTSITLSEETEEALQSLCLFPYLELVTFSAKNYPYVPCVTPWSIRDEDASSNNPLRAFISQSLRALCMSWGTFDKLRIEELPPAWYPIFDSRFWTQLLDGLLSLDIVLKGPPSWHEKDFAQVHGQFLDAVPDIFLAHTRSLEHLRIHASERGFDAFRFTYMDWAAVKLPCLRTWELGRLFLNESVAQCLYRHADTLEELRLFSCIANKAANWEEIFEAIAGGEHMDRLVKFDVWGSWDNNESLEEGVEEEEADTIEMKFPIGDICAEMNEHLDHTYFFRIDEETKDDMITSWDRAQTRVAGNRAAAGLPAVPWTTLHYET